MNSYLTTSNYHYLACLCSVFIQQTHKRSATIIRNKNNGYQKVLLKPCSAEKYLDQEEAAHSSASLLINLRKVTTQPAIHHRKVRAYNNTYSARWRLYLCPQIISCIYLYLTDTNTLNTDADTVSASV